VRRVTIIVLVSRFASLLLPVLPAAALAASGAAGGLLPPDLPAAAAPAGAASKPRGASASAGVDDATLAMDVAEALLRARIGGVQIEARGGRVTLRGVVDAASARRALQAARAVAGVREIEDRLVSAEVFEHD
jgi:hypothetical protein